MKLNWESLGFIMNEDTNERAKFTKHRNINCLASKASKWGSGKEPTSNAEDARDTGSIPE